MKKLLLFAAFFLTAMSASAQAPDFSVLENAPRPRLFASAQDFEAMKAQQSGETVFAFYNESLLAALRKGEAPKLVYKKDESGKRILGISRSALKEIFWCSWAYKMTGEDVFLKRVETAIKDVCAFPDWNPSHYLDTGEMALGVSIGYDWLYDVLDPEVKKLAAATLKKYALDSATERIDKGQFKYSNNWGSVCFGGLVSASIAIYDDNKDQAQKIINHAIKEVAPVLKNSYDPCGFYPEGATYWSYGTSFQTVLNSVLEHSFGTEFGMCEAPGFKETPIAQMYYSAPDGNFNFSDCGLGTTLDKCRRPALWYFARRFQDTSMAYLEYVAIDRAKKNGELLGASDRLEPLYVLNTFFLPKTEGAVAPPAKAVVSSKGGTELVIARTGWEMNDLYLGIKAGSPLASHSHLDEGSFVFDAFGQRWSSELGQENYANIEAALLGTGYDFWARGQNSARWQVFSVNNKQHSTITVNEKDFPVDCRAYLTDVIDEPNRIGGTLDMSNVYASELANAQRTAVIRNGKYLEVTDVLTAPEGKDATIRWTLVTLAQPQLKNRGIKLSQGGVKMMLKAAGAKVKYCQWSNDPRDFNTLTAKSERDFSNFSVVGYTMTVPAGKTVTLVTTMKRKKLF